MEMIRQSSRFLWPKYLFVEVDEQVPLFQLVDEAKQLIDDSGIPVVFNYRGVAVRVNPCVETKTILEAWEISKQQTEERVLRVVYADGEEVL